VRLMERVLKEAYPHLQGLTVVDGVIGISFVGVQLSNGRCHYVYLMREAIPSGDMIFQYGLQMIGMDAWEVAQWALTGAEDVQRGLGVAALNAASPYYTPNQRSTEDFYSNIQPDDTLGLIGYMPPVFQSLGDKVKQIYCFDRAIEMQGTVENAQVYPISKQAELLPLCDKVIISATTMINHTTEQIIAMCTKAIDIQLSGFSLPYYPEAYRDSGLTALGTLSFNERSHELIKLASLGAGRMQMRQYTIGQFCRLRPPFSR
jgi:uncharacterized protein (DUF4213/DUF364 family)